MKKLLAFILAMLMILVAFAGCGGGGTSTSEGGSSNSEAESKWPSGYPFQEGAFAGQKLQWWNHWENVDTNGYVAEFEEATGAKIEYTMLSGGGGSEYYTQVNSGIAAGTGPDVAVVYNWAMPAWIQKGLLEPISSVLDLSEDIYKEKVSQAMLDFFYLNGESYAIISQGTNAYYLIYRKDLIDEAGLDDPYELWENGEWSYDVFNEYLNTLTYDSNDDGIVDKWGITGYYDEGWLGTAENGNYVRWDEEGRPVFALTAPEMLETLVENRHIGDNGWITNTMLPVEEFVSGNVAFLYSAPWDWSRSIDTFGIENIGWVQLPYAPANTSKVVLNRCNAVAYAFTNNLDVPELAEEYIKYSMFWERKDVNKAETEQEIIDASWGGSREFYEFDKLMQTMTFAPNDGCFGILTNLLQALVLWGQTDTPANCVAAAQPLCQAEIDKIFYGE